MAMATQPVLVMGVSGVGKTTVARGLAQRLDAVFIDADDHHPAANVAAMQRGEPLTDDQRWGWLDRLAEVIADTKPSAVVACSALKRSYRDRLRRRVGPLQIVFLTGDRALLSDRMSARSGHYMPVSLLDSQIATLQPPEPDEAALTLSVADPAAALIDRAVTFLSPRLQGGPVSRSGQTPTDPRRKP